MQSPRILPHLPHSGISIEALKKGSIKEHAAFCQLAFPVLEQQVKALINDELEAPVMTAHMFIKLWIACGRLDDIMDIYNFLDRRIWKDCQAYRVDKGSADAPIKLMYKEIFTPGILQGQTYEALFANMEQLDEKVIDLARGVFSFRYSRNYPYTKIQEVIGIPISEVLNYERLAMQILYLIISKNILK